MDLLIWITIGFIIVGFTALNSIKTSMENQLAYIISNLEDEESSIKAKSIIWWIVSAAAWGIVSMILIVWCFHNYIG
ncbi:hypothetical protein ACFQWC_20675 [Rossellomorea sp. GCM10028870]|uniref:hypothetical protein n=1 Tax=unclassified Rossellomorea TaxID=2837526 RepID=UPI0030E42878